MPFSTSYFKEQTKNYIVKNYAKDAKILDIGAGAGTYSDMLKPEGFSNLHCVEAFARYLDEYKLGEKYSKVFYGDVTKLDIDFHYYDLIILGDVLEHINLEEAQKLLEKITKSDVIVAVPFKSTQGIHFDNTYEIHLQDDLTFINFFERFKGFVPFCLRWDYGVFLKRGLNEILYIETAEHPVPEEYKNYITSEYKEFKIIDLNAKEVDFNKTPTVSELEIKNKDLTVVTGLWNLNRPGRNFDQYLDQFKKLLEFPVFMFIYIPKEYEHIVWEKRSRDNTHVQVYELEDIKNGIYNPHWGKTQEIRTSETWRNIAGEGGWLKNSPQALLEYYNPIVESKMFFLHNASVLNPLGTEYFLWLDAGITFTVYEKYFQENRVLDKINKYLDSFLFLSYPYEARDEIHGFDFEAINKYAGTEVKYVCRGGLFGGHKTQIDQTNGLYYLLLERTLSDGYMGTEESIFSIMAHLYPELYRRYELDENGFIVKFTEALLKDTVKLVEVDKPRGKVRTKSNYTSLKDVKTNVYILTFNFPEQVRYIVDSMKKVPEWIEQPHIVLLDNSTLEEAKIQNSSLAKELGFEYIWLQGNTGICGGRQAAADHFNNSEADYMLFFEDDMTINSVEEEGNFCRKGFRKYIPNLYEILHKIMLKENFDFLKLSFSEVYWDNNIQTSWYNVPQNIRSLVWPDYDKLPVTGIDPNAPRTKFNTIDELDGVSYITGEIVYSNWPMVVSKEGNKKMFIDTKWDHPYEQTWMSHLFQETLKGRLKGAVLLASPVFHNRIAHYQREDRREN